MNNIVVLNAGHAHKGNPDPGAVSPNGVRESDLVYLIGEGVQSRLFKVGYEVPLLQSDSLETVCFAANASNSDIFVSIHCNSADNPSANGLEIWYQSEEGKWIAECVLNSVASLVPIGVRGVKQSVPHVNGLYVLQNTNMPAILIELGFLSNDYDERLLTNEHWQEEFMEGIAVGITDWYQAKRKEENNGE